jgi:hypothetical protein
VSNWPLPFRRFVALAGTHASAAPSASSQNFFPKILLDRERSERSEAARRSVAVRVSDSQLTVSRLVAVAGTHSCAALSAAWQSFSQKILLDRERSERSEADSSLDPPALLTSPTQNKC